MNDRPVAIHSCLATGMILDLIIYQWINAAVRSTDTVKIVDARPEYRQHATTMILCYRFCELRDAQLCRAYVSIAPPFAFPRIPRMR